MGLRRSAGGSVGVRGSPRRVDVVLPVVTTVSTIFSPSLEQIVQMQLVNTAPTVYAPRIGEEVDDGFSGAIIDRPGFPPFPIGIR